MGSQSSRPEGALDAPTGDSDSTSARILAAAKRLFLVSGYRQTSLEDVGTEAGVTKPTVYSHFGSKEGLLLAMVRSLATENATVLSQSLDPSGDTANDLRVFGELFLRRLLSEQAVNWRRLAMTQSAERPEVGQAVFESGPARVLQSLTHFIDQEAQSGRLHCSDPETAAEQFMGLLLGLTPIREMTAQPMPDKSMQQRRVQAAVTTFMAAFGSGSDAPEESK